jgi:hypothetical protein
MSRKSKAKEMDETRFRRQVAKLSESLTKARSPWALRKARQEFESLYIDYVMHRADHNRRAAVDMLDISLSSLKEKIEPISAPARARAKARKGSIANTKKGSLSHGRERFLKQLSGKRALTQATISAYRRCINEFCEFLEAKGRKKVADMKPGDVTAYRRQVSRRKLANNSRTQRVQAVDQWIDYLGDEGDIARAKFPARLATKSSS